MRSFGADSTTAEVVDGIDLRGKVALELASLASARACAQRVLVGERFDLA